MYKGNCPPSVLSIRPGTCWSTNGYSFVNHQVYFRNFQGKCDLKHLKIFFPYKQVLIKNDLYFLFIYSSIHFIHFQQKRAWVSKNILTQISVTSNHMSLQRIFCLKLREQACMAAYGRFWSEIKQSGNQLLQRRGIFNNHLRKLNPENFVWSQFILNGSNGITRGKLFHTLFSSRCFTKVATFFKSYWKHCSMLVMGSRYSLVLSNIPT